MFLEDSQRVDETLNVRLRKKSLQGLHDHLGRSRWTSACETCLVGLSFNFVGNDPSQFQVFEPFSRAWILHHPVYSIGSELIF